MTARPTTMQMLEELLDLTAGLGVMLMPALILAVPGIILFVVLPGLLILAVALPVALVGAAILGPPYLVVRLLRRRLSRPAPAAPLAARASSAA
jgi:Flp pilus assembly protein TadB